MQEDSLKKRYIIKLFANIISGIIGAVIIAIVPKSLGPIAYGQFVYLQDFFMKAISFLDMGSSIAFFTKLSSRNYRKELITFYLIYSLVILVFLFSFLIIINNFNFTSYILPDIPNEYIYFGLFFGFFTWFTQIFIKISDAYALTVSVELIKIGHKIISLFLLLYFIYFTSFNLFKYFTFHYISLVSFLLILSLLFIKKNIFSKTLFTLEKFEFGLITKEFISFCHPLFLYNILGLLSGMFDIWLLQSTAGSEQTGFYGLAYSLSAMCFMFTSAMTPIITREFSKSYEQNDLSNMRRLFYRYIPVLYSLAAYLSIFISVQSENLLIVFTDEKFKEAFLILSIMALYPIHQTYGQLSGGIFYATGQTKLMKNISFFTIPLGIIISFGLIYILDLGAIGLAYKMIIIQFIGVNIQLYFNSKLLGLNMMSLLLHQVYTVLIFALLAYIPTQIIFIDSPLYEFLLSGLLYSVLVIFFLYLYPKILFRTRDELKKIFTYLKGG